MMKFAITNRWTGAVQVMAEIPDTAGSSPQSRLGLAVRWAINNQANLSQADLCGADLREATLDGANLRGARLEGANLFQADLCGADLRGATLYRARLEGANLFQADLDGADLRGAMLYRANLRGARLDGASLDGANLYEADLSGARLEGATLDVAEAPIPQLAHIDAAILAAIGASQSAGHVGLNMRGWHTCPTTHCRAGWAITLAGAAGTQLEARVGSATAGALIYAVSRPALPLPDFYASNAETLTDLEEAAACDPLPPSESALRGRALQSLDK